MHSCRENGDIIVDKTREIGCDLNFCDCESIADILSCRVLLKLGLSPSLSPHD